MEKGCMSPYSVKFY